MAGKARLFKTLPATPYTGGVTRAHPWMTRPQEMPAPPDVQQAHNLWAVKGGIGPAAQVPDGFMTAEMYQEGQQGYDTLANPAIGLPMPITMDMRAEWMRKNAQELEAARAAANLYLRRNR